MRIIKETEGAILRLAQEMYNIEAGAEVYRGGERLQTRIPGYPKFTIDGVEYRVKATHGYVYYSGKGVDVDQLKQELTKLGDQSHLEGYHTIVPGECASVKVRVTTKVNKRIIATTSDDFGKLNHDARFRWSVLPISNFDHNIDNTQGDVVDRYACSIFYDRDGICTLDDGAVVFDFSRECLVGWRHFTNQSVLLSLYLNPIAFELNQYWRKLMPAGSSVLAIHRNISSAKVYRGEYSKVRIAPVQVESGDMRDDVCSKCREPLYDDIYILTRPVKNPDCEDGIAICPLCMHMHEKRLEMRYMYVFVVRHPRSINDVIDSLNESPERRAILKSAARGIRVDRFGDNDAVYYDIGDYLVVKDIDNYLCSVMSTLNTKRVVLLSTIDGSDWILDPAISER